MGFSEGQEEHVTIFELSGILVKENAVMYLSQYPTGRDYVLRNMLTTVLALQGGAHYEHFQSEVVETNSKSVKPNYCPRVEVWKAIKVYKKISGSFEKVRGYIRHISVEASRLGEKIFIQFEYSANVDAAIYRKTKVNLYNRLVLPVLLNKLNLINS